MENHSNLSRTSTEQIKKYIKKQGTLANIRLRKIEEEELQNSSNAYRYIEKIDYDENIAVKRNKKNQIIFNLSTKNMSREQLIETASKIKKFVSAKTSTPEGTKAKYEKAYKTFTEQNPELASKTGLTKEKFGEMFSAGILKRFSDIYGSKELISISTNNNLSDREIEEVLRTVGFNENSTEENSPTLSEIYQAIENSDDIKQQIGSQGLFNFLTDEERNLLDYGGLL